MVSPVQVSNYSGRGFSHHALGASFCGSISKDAKVKLPIVKLISVIWYHVWILTPSSFRYSSSGLSMAAFGFCVSFLVDFHQNDDTWVLRCLRSLASQLLAQELVQAMKEKISNFELLALLGLGAVRTIRQDLAYANQGPQPVMTQFIYKYGSGHETVAVLLPGFAIKW